MVSICCITYNQEKYIIEHLESIKHQIIKFGGNYQNHIIICDDCSYDNTVRYAESWIKQNIQILCGFKIIRQEANRGIVINYLAGLDSVKTELFSLVAGDDMYFDNSVYEAAETSNFVYTPRISFYSKGNIKREQLWLFKSCMMTRLSVHEEMKHWMKYRMVIDVMSVKWRKQFYTSELIAQVKKYKWVEDYPTMEYILNDSRIDSTLYLKPIVLYRDDSGISNNKIHNKKSEYNMEQVKLFNDYKLKIASAPKYINIYNYYYVIKKMILTIKGKFNIKVKMFEFDYNIECDRARAYLESIKQKSQEINCNKI